MQITHRERTGFHKFEGLSFRTCGSTGFWYRQHAMIATPIKC